MKKQMILGITALALLAGTGTATLVSCQPDYPAVTVELNRNTIQAEVGGTYTLRSTVNSSESISNFMSNFTTDNEEIIEFTTTTTGATNVSFTAKAIGTATITATSVVNPDVKAVCTVTVGEALPTLPEVFSTLNTAHNYTITTEITGDSINEEDIPTQTTVLTENALLNYLTFPSGENAPMYSAIDENGDTMNFNENPSGEPIYGSNWGLVALDDGSVTYLQYDNQNNVVENAYRVKGATGFLTKDNFDGSGVSSVTSANPYFTSLAVIDTSVLPSEKRSDNTYEIVGTEENTALLFAECGLFQSVSSYFQMLVYQLTNDASYLGFSTNIDTTITVTSANTFIATFTYTDDSVGEITATATVSNVGTTTLDDISGTGVPTDIQADIASLKPYTPELAQVLSDLITAIDTNNYSFTGSYSNDYVESFNLTDYYAPNYFISQVYDYEGVSAFVDAGVDISSIKSAVYYLKDNKIYGDTISYELSEGSLISHLDGKPTLGVKLINGSTLTEATQEEFYQVFGYLGASGLFSKDVLINFTDNVAFNVPEGTYGTDNDDLAKLYFEYMGVYDQTLEQFPGITDLYVMLTPTKAAEQVSSLTISLLFDPTNSGNFFAYNMVYQFSKGTSYSLNQAILDQIAA